MDDDPLAGVVAGEVGRVVAEIAAGIARDVELDGLRRLHPHLVDLQHRTGDSEVVRERRRPLVDVYLLQVLLGLGLNCLTHLLAPRLEGVSEFTAAVEEEVVHAVEDTGGRRRLPEHEKLFRLH